LKGKTLTSCGISGRECSASLELLNANSSAGGICWFYGEAEPKNFKVIYENRTTILVHSSGKKIIGVEHLNAAALAFPNCEFALNAPQGELPLLDGSAKLWQAALNAAADCPNNLNFYVPQKKQFEIGTNERYLKYNGGGVRADLCVCPAAALEIQYTINRFNQKFQATVQIKTTADLEKIFSARTFIFEQELQTVKLSENLRNCGVLLQTGKKNDLRFENEPAYHKILDFLGDISIYSNALPLGKFTILNGGHELHHTATGALIAGYES
jgi:UDP-3-O-[3-hydroxymyristoyl] N-acetylglucosamine deacetylase